MSEEEITSHLAGEVGDIDNDESVALIFAQHYAESQAKPRPRICDKDYLILMEMRKPMILLASFKLLWMGNIHGISIDLLQSRLKGKSDPDSSFWTEFSTVFGIILFVPCLGIKKMFGFLKPRQIDKIEPSYKE